MFDKYPATAIMEKELLPFETYKLPEFYQKKAERELNETSERRIQGLRQMKDFVKNENAMRNEKFEEEFLLEFLRARKFNVARAFSNLKSLVELKRKNPHLFCNFRFENLVKSITSSFLTVLPLRCQDGCTILLVDLDNWNPEEIPVEELKKLYIIVFLQSVKYPMTQVNGYKVIFHSKTPSLRQLRHYTPQNLYFLVNGLLNCAPARYINIHAVSEAITIKTGWMIMKHFLSEKMKKRVIFHPTQDTLLNYFPKEVLPVKYGGSLENYDMSQWLWKVTQPEEVKI